MELNQLLLNTDSMSGVWCRYEGDFELLIASASTPEFEAQQNAELEPYLQLIREGKLDKEKELEIEARVLSQNCVKDWRGLTSNGQPVPYSPEELARMLTHKGGFRLLKFVRSSAYGLANYRNKLTEAAKGN